MDLLEHELYMKEALREARIAYDKGEVPIGAIIIDKQGEIIARAHNLRESLRDPTAHAEVLVIKEASKKLGGWRLNDCTLYVTLEPCPMCAGALIQSRIKHVIFGAKDPKAGCAGSLCNILEDKRFNHQVNITEGILENESSTLLKNFFRKLRNNETD